MCVFQESLNSISLRLDTCLCEAFSNNYVGIFTRIYDLRWIVPAGVAEEK